jgi:hypothetical protein
MMHMADWEANLLSPSVGLQDIDCMNKSVHLKIPIPTFVSKIYSEMAKSDSPSMST